VDWGELGKQLDQEEVVVEQQGQMVMALLEGHQQQLQVGHMEQVVLVVMVV
jgi:hypothetical protein